MLRVFPMLDSAVSLSLFTAHLYNVHKMLGRKGSKVFKCSQCDYVSHYHCHLKTHMKKHLNIKDITCKECGQGFSRVSNLRKHIQWRHMEKMFQCDFCGRATGTINQLKEHIRCMHTHRDHKPYKCAYCEYHSTTSGNCRKHVMHKHKGLEVKVLKVMDKYPKSQPAHVLTNSVMNKSMKHESQRKQMDSRQISPLYPDGHTGTGVASSTHQISPENVNSILFIAREIPSSHIIPKCSNNTCMAVPFGDGCLEILQITACKPDYVNQGRKS